MIPIKAHRLIALFLAAFLTGAAPLASASVSTQQRTTGAYKISQPVVSCECPAAQARINEAIAQRIADFTSAARSQYFREGTFSYRTMYEDAQYVSLLICESTYEGGAHGHPVYTGLTFDKRTGALLPLPHFALIGTDDVATIYELPVYRQDGTRIAASFLSELQKKHPLSGNYYLMGGGRIALVFQPYEMASYADGVTHIILSDAYVRALNEKNAQK